MLANTDTILFFYCLHPSGICHRESDKALQIEAVAIEFIDTSQMLLNYSRVSVLVVYIFSYSMIRLPLFITAKRERIEVIHWATICILVACVIY